jgi:hypothetical protein
MAEDRGAAMTLRFNAGSVDALGEPMLPGARSSRPPAAARFEPIGRLA